MLQEWLLDEDTKRYRKALIEEVVEHIRPLIWNGADAKEVKGAMDMARKIFRLPLKLGNEAMKDKTASMLFEDMKEFETRFIRSHLEEE